MQQKTALTLALFLLLSCNPSRRNNSSAAINPYSYTVQKKIIAAKGAVVSAHPLASKVGLEILHF